MQIFNELNRNPDMSLALGFFDGVHSGHRKVIESAVNFARQNGKKSAVITFADHPCCFLWGVCPKYILTREERQEKIAALGIDYLYELNFEEISGLTAEDYLKSVIVKYFTPSAISTGWNHNFGYKKSGNPKFLSENSKKFGYEYFELPPEKFGKEIISSTSIRNLLSKGEIENANSMLGYKFSLSGNVIKGNQIGRTIGFPTANLNYPPELIELPYGVYSVDVILNEVNNEKYKGIANFGTRPTIDGHNTVLEIHILDFNEDIYNQKISVEFNKMIRTEKKFTSLDALKKQIQIDMQSI